MTRDVRLAAMENIRMAFSARCESEREREEDAVDAIVSQMDLAEIRVAPENEKIYRPVVPTDPEIQDLAASIQVHGVREPLVLSLDLYLLSGHRRRAAAELAGLVQVPVRFEAVWRDEDPDYFLTLLREHNRQRVKSFDEAVHEAVIDADPEECRAELVAYRKAKAKVGHDSLSIPAAHPRRRISEAKRPFVTAIKKAIEDYRDFWPLTVRQVHYALLNDPPQRHAGKPRSGYANDLGSYKSLVELATRMRLVGEDHWAWIPMECINDETRPVTVWKVHRDVGTFIRQEIDGFLKGYSRDLMVSQPNHVEVVVEKNTVAGIVKEVCMEFCIPMTSGRGYSSTPPRAGMAQRFRDSGKEKLVVVFVTDFDPEGEGIVTSFVQRMRDDFGIESLEPFKAALTEDQVKAHDLPRNFKAKPGSSRTAGFVERHGEHVFELEALPPATLQEIVRDCITGVIDIDRFNHEQRAEGEDAARLRAMRVTVSKALEGVIDTEVANA